MGRRPGVKNKTPFLDMRSGVLSYTSGNYEYLIFWFFSNLVGEEGPRIPGVKDSSVCLLKILSAL